MATASSFPLLYFHLRSIAQSQQLAGVFQAESEFCIYSGLNNLSSVKKKNVPS